MSQANNSATNAFLPLGVFVCPDSEKCRHLQCRACLLVVRKRLCRSDFLTVGYFQKAREEAVPNILVIQNSFRNKGSCCLLA